MRVERFVAVICLTAVVSASCCPRITPQSSHRTDSVRVVRQTQYVEKWRDTTVFVEVPVEVKMQVERDSSHLETSVALSQAWIADGLLHHTLENKAEPLPAVVKVRDTDVRERSDSVVYRDVYIRDVVERVRIPKSYWLFMSVTILSAIVVAIKAYHRVRLWRARFV